jgi:DNA-binding CsgD family transcriptional regulator
LDHAIAAERGQRVNGQAQGLAWALAIRALIECGLGDEASARRAVAEGLVLARDVAARATELELCVVAGVLARAAGDLPGAARLLHAGVQPLLDEGYSGPHLLWGLPELAEVFVILDRVPEAESLLDGYEAVARRLDRASALAAAVRVRGLIAAAAGREDDARRAFAEAIGHHDRVPEPFARGRTLLAQGEALRRFRRRGEAREVLGEAVAIFETLGARRWRERAAAELARTGHRGEGASLSPTEHQVAQLVAAGRTNREVAEALFMSPHTVEAHLTRIYRSLGIRGRTDLVRVIAARSPDGSAELTGLGRAGPEHADPEPASRQDGGYG